LTGELTIAPLLTGELTVALLLTGELTVALLLTGELPLIDGSAPIFSPPSKYLTST